ncbi:MAG: hypothetical protein QOJ11_3458 [Frankiales bacterium]|jgi:hypothetical protein|nr:hypothetical protein [Frankiales bacterium]
MTDVPRAEPVLPLLGLALTRRPPEGALPLLVALHEWCLPATLDPAAGKPTAILATAEGLHLAPAGVRVALWAQAEDITSDAFRTATVILSDDPTVVAAAGDRGLRAPTGRHLGGRRPMSPFVRERLRHGRGLPPDALLERLETGWVFGRPAALEPIEVDLVETAMGAAAAVVVTEPGWLMRALAWAAPTVTNAATAAAVGALAPAEVLVAETARARTAAAVALSADPVEASRLSWRGYRRAESHDAERAAMTLVDRLGLWPDTPPRPAPPLPTVELALRLLGTPTDAHVRTRLADAADTLTPAT